MTAIGKACFERGLREDYLWPMGIFSGGERDAGGWELVILITKGLLTRKRLLTMKDLLTVIPIEG
jgi:hypothetical protein